MRIPIHDDRLREAFLGVCRTVEAAGGRALLVGGSVRDALLGEELVDLDLEVQHLEPDALRATLAAGFPLDLVGESFGVLKLKHLPIDVALPRREAKHGRGHRGFTVQSDPHLPFAEAAARRDFTINAMGFDPLREELLDPHDGRRDLERRTLRHVSPAFSEDPLRVLRGMQFAARFQLDGAPETLALCRSIEPEDLARERVFEEWRKLILRGVEISRGLTFLEASGWLAQFPELEALRGCQQDPEWHPEGDVFTHTGHVMDAFAARRIGDAWEDLVVGFGALCHDFGKPATTHFEGGRWRSPMHEQAGEAPTRSFLGRMTDQSKLIDAVVPLVVEHMKPVQLFQGEAGPSAVRRLAAKVDRLDRLVRVARADYGGRPPLAAEPFPAADWLIERAESLRIADAAPRPIVLGRHVLELGMEPGPAVGRLLAQVFEAQLDGEFETLEGGIEKARGLMAAGSRAVER